MGGGVEADEMEVHIREISDADVRVNALKIVKDGLHLSDEGFLVHELLLCSVRVTTRGGEGNCVVCLVFGRNPIRNGGAARERRQ